MGRLLRHRGPDDEGYLVAGTTGTAWFGGEDTPRAVLESDVPYAPRVRVDAAGRLSGGVVLGHRRLSILDLSPHGHQPMVYRSRYWIVFNGEVYNYVELREELQERGHVFLSGSDTEVVLAAYAEWGPDCLQRFNGMWALAILDAQRKELFLARDRFGVKPLYYRVEGGRLAFASEIKAFAALSDWRARANVARLLDFLVWSVTDHTADTMFEGVRQLPAGHLMTCGLRGMFDRGEVVVEGQLVPQRWYTVGPADSLGPAERDEQLRVALTESVRLRLRADVPVGSCLSGGLDSSTIVCLMSGLLRQAGVAGRVKTFTASSNDREFDETEYAKAVSERARSDSVFVTPEPAKLFEDLSRLVWHQDEPFASSSIFAQWCVFEAARRHGVIVMLDGQGADETLCGYRGFFGAYLAGLVRAGRLAAWGAEVGAMHREIGWSWTRSLGYTAAYLVPGALRLIGRFDGRAYADRGWVRPEHATAFTVDPIRRLGGRSHSVRAMSHVQISATHLPMLLHWEDRNSMAFSIEARVPFLDYRVVELSLALEDHDKLGGGISKGALRRAMRGTVPDKVIERRDKLGFVTAEPLWMRRDLSTRFRSEIRTAVDVLPGVLAPSLMERFDEVLEGKRPFDQRYWRALSAGRWASTFSVAV
jgi:asparagine synthase (glutamine-hydrolysing)